MPPVDQPRSQGSLLPALRRAAVTAGRREPWERGCQWITGEIQTPNRSKTG